MTIIYAITCPITGQVRYVGKTDSSLGKRLASHLIGCRTGRDAGNKKNIWMKGIVDADLVPGIQILERVPDGASWQEAEIRWIAHYRALVGDLLLNASNGGKGNLGFSPSAETRAKISASGKARAPYKRKPHTPETKAKISAILKSRPSNQPIGYKHSQETLAKMSEAGKNRAPISDETRSRLSAVRMGHPVSPETRAKIGAKVAAAAARKRAEKEVANG